MRYDMQVALPDGGENKVEAPRIVCRLLKERSARSGSGCYLRIHPNIFSDLPEGASNQKWATRLEPPSVRWLLALAKNRQPDLDAGLCPSAVFSVKEIQVRWVRWVRKISNTEIKSDATEEISSTRKTGFVIIWLTRSKVVG
jgi:hypothetical protein